MNTLVYLEKAFSRVGWFIPPYVALGFLHKIAKETNDAGDDFTQKNLEMILTQIYSSVYLAAMVCERYPITEHVKEYKGIISESVAAHFLGLDHLAVIGLMPVIEGCSKKIGTNMSINPPRNCSGDFLVLLAEACKNKAIENNIGAVGEIVSMMNSFGSFAKKYLFVDSSQYPLDDMTNRHGILHGAFTDRDYGNPINFYKCIAAVDFLCFASGFSTGYMPCFAANSTIASQKLAAKYMLCSTVRKQILP